MNDGHEQTVALPVAPIPELGSPLLAQALTNNAYASVLEAIAYDVVLLPVVVLGDQVHTRIFPGRGGMSLKLFSSAKTWQEYIGNDPHRAFVLRPGASVVEYLAQFTGQLVSVIFDDASPARLEVPVAALAQFAVGITPEEADDELWLEGDTEPEGEIIGFDMDLPGPWGVVDLQSENRNEKIKALVKRQTAVLSDAGAATRHQLRQWLESSSRQAAERGGLTMGFLLGSEAGAGLSITLITYWHDLRLSAARGARPWELLVANLQEQAEAEDQVAHFALGDTMFVRHLRHRRGTKQMWAESIELLLIDYWVQAPDGHHLAQISFSTPHTNVEELITQLADNIALGVMWQYAEEASET